MHANQLSIYAAKTRREVHRRFALNALVKAQPTLYIAKPVYQSEVTRRITALAPHVCKPTNIASPQVRQTTSSTARLANLAGHWESKLVIVTSLFLDLSIRIY